jgi:hypothetical protein
MGFEIMSIVGLGDEPAAFWARAAWDPDITLYAPSKPLLRKRIRDYWETK